MWKRVGCVSQQLRRFHGRGHVGLWASGFRGPSSPPFPITGESKRGSVWGGGFLNEKEVSLSRVTVVLEDMEDKHPCVLAELSRTMLPLLYMAFLCQWPHLDPGPLLSFF